MPRLLKTQVKQRTDEIKNLILSDAPFELELARLYIDLSLQKQHTRIVQTYQLLCLYIEEKQHYRLYHPALLQAFILLGQMPQARTVAQYLRQQKPVAPETSKLLHAMQVREQSILPAYTPLASLSKYAKKTSLKTGNTPRNLPDQWTRILPTITPEKLEEIGYYAQRNKLAHAPQPYRTFLLKDFDELVLNYLFRHHRSVLVMAGALLEMLLASHLYAKLRLKRVMLEKQSKYVFDLNLNELIYIAEQKKLLPAHTLRLCRAARMQRNFIHPGKEILEHTRLTPSGMRICFLAVLETIDALL